MTAPEKLASFALAGFKFTSPEQADGALFAVKDAIQQAIAEEREACARIARQAQDSAEQSLQQGGLTFGVAKAERLYGRADAAISIATAIRSRGEQDGRED